LELPRGSEMRVKKRQKYGGDGGFSQTPLGWKFPKG